MIRHIDPVSPATAAEPSHDRPHEGGTPAQRREPAPVREAGIVHFSGAALTRRPGRPRVPPPDTWAGAMLDLVFDVATATGDAIRQDPEQAAAAQANGASNRAWELTS